MPAITEARWGGTEVASHATPIGTLESVWTDRGLIRLVWKQGIRLSSEETPGSALVYGDRSGMLDEQLIDYFSGQKVTFKQIPLDSTGWTPFFLRVYSECRKILPGTTVHYGELATMAGRPGAARAVGQAMSRNEIPLVIPCHRVIAASGGMCGFNAPGGIETKRMLLELEQAY